MSKRPILLYLCTWMLACSYLLTALADGPADNQPDNVRRVPKIGVEVPDADRQELEQGLKTLSDQIERLKKGDATAQKLLPDVLIFHRAVDQALRYREFFDAKEIPVAKQLLQQGQQRAENLLAGKAPWTQQKGPVVRGYISKIDKTVQPIGLVIPPEYDFVAQKPYRLDFWFHGRGETLSELSFINDRSKNIGAINPPETIVLHPYGRYCNANKFAGEVDSFEALAAVEQQYRVDPDRISVRGFSMGGAAAWQFAVHYPDRWFAANPGAGFSETPEFLKVFQKETLTPSWYEQKLWEMYDCPGYAANLAQLPTIAYSGEVDSQKQAADIMATAFEREGMKLLHVIGPKTAHSIHPESKKEIEAKLAEWAVKGIDHSPTSLQFVTFTLSYNRMHWLTVDGLKEHWEEVRVTAKPVGDELVVQTKNVSALTLRPPKGSPRKVRLDDSTPLGLPMDGSPGSFVLGANGWQAGKLTGLHKEHGLQGPIDDAFLDSFVFVKPSGKGRSENVDKWVQSEFDHAVTHWRQQMRGDAIVKSDTEITDQDIASSNLVLWGDAQSNKVLAKIVDKLPIRWTDSSVIAGDQAFDGVNHALIAIYPNPLNPKKYIVLNSSFTYREYDYLNNARQTPKLPDWVIVDVRTPANSRLPGKIVAADFFDERWKLKPVKTK